ncbi:NADPH:quinone oxidoreductase family protein [Nocardioides sp. LHD-245]|uniref:quinone oxidoreductase family protein n=1 Tax=Nocardioides sp. LHD-245 TaxID=3051387 RepID=UPI0027DFF6C4|nr:NADPH:quinone oxidoreductase family protein [Nocardioides sp. LHD-245]
MNATYTAVACDRFGPPGEVLATRRLPRRVLGAGEARLWVRATGLNFLDATLCRGAYPVKPAFPATPGVETAGTVIETGAEAESWLGREVVACPTLPDGALGEEVVVPAALLVDRPASIPPEVAAALPVTYQTAWWALERARVGPGDRVLVHGAAGGVGSATIQLARLRGASVIATAGTAAKVAHCLEQGAEAAFDSGDAGLAHAILDAGGPVDIVVDPVAGRLFDVSLQVIAFEGRYVAVGQAGGSVTVDPVRLTQANADLVGLSWGSTYPFAKPDAVRAVYGELFADVAAGRLAPVVSRVVTLDEAPAALDDLESGRTHGKIVVRMEETES